MHDDYTKNINVWSHQSLSWHKSSANNANVSGFGTLSHFGGSAHVIYVYSPYSQLIYISKRKGKMRLTADLCTVYQAKRAKIWFTD